MAARQLSNGDDSGTCLGQDAADLISFHGASPSAKGAAITLTTGSTLATVETAVQTVIARLVAKGLLTA